MSLLVRPVRFALSAIARRSFAVFSPTVSKASTIAEVCEWASRSVALSGAGLDEDDVAILRREKIEGASLLTLTDAELTEDDMPRGARKKLLAAIAVIREPQGALDYNRNPLRHVGIIFVSFMRSDLATGGAVPG